MLIRTLNKCIKQDYPVTIGDYASALQDEIFFRQLGCDLRAKGYKKYRVEQDIRTGRADKNETYFITPEDITNIILATKGLNNKERYKCWCDLRRAVTGYCPIYVNEKGKVVPMCREWNKLDRAYFPKVENMWSLSEDYESQLMDAELTLRQGSCQNVGRLI